MQPETTGLFDDTTITDGICVVDGHGISITVQRRHLHIEDGIGQQRRTRRFHKTSRDLNRIVVVAGTGYVSLDAYRWLADTGTHLIHLDREGRLLAISAGLGSDKAALRRAQVNAGATAVGVDITRWILASKLERQADIVDGLDGDSDQIRNGIAELEDTDDYTLLRAIEAQAAITYWNTWRNRIAPAFVRKDQPRVPEHWLAFDTRHSPVTRSPRLAANPVNALLNYLYALTEAETRIACLTVGLDPGIGFLHADQPSRDSLALDLMEPVRPVVDGWLISLFDSHIFRASDFHEDRRGVCRITPALSQRLVQTLPMIRDEIAPIAETVAQRIADTNSRIGTLTTPLTQSRRAAGRPVRNRTKAKAAPPKLAASCGICGTGIDTGRKYCNNCLPVHTAEKLDAMTERSQTALAKLREQGHDPAHGGRAARKRGDSSREQNSASRHWEANNARPPRTVWERQIAPRLDRITVAQIMNATGLSSGYASMIKRGVKIPHPRHWDTLRQLAGDDRHRPLE